MIDPHDNANDRDDQPPTDGASPDAARPPGPSASPAEPENTGTDESARGTAGAGARPDAADGEPTADADADPEPTADADAGPDVGPDVVDGELAGEPRDDEVGAATGGPRWRRIAAAIFTPKLTAANMVIALLLGVLGFALIVQVRSNANESTLANDRPDDLVRILSDLDARKDRLTTEISSLQNTVQQLNSGAQSQQAALDAAAKRADELGILGGTLPARGPGLVIDLIPASGQQIPANTVLDTIEELRGAGAEAMQISGTGSAAVRVVAATYFTDTTGGVDIDGATIGGTLSITVIGDPQTIQAALSIPGGVDDTVRNDGGTVSLQTPGTVEVTALHEPQALQYAHSVP
ncbi:MAG TPA: DUF881 domain-containing protein [Micromonosporaceae bacterium]|nr:DUF881 domain-containing protein [Micromonosporaceae bacterium]